MVKKKFDYHQKNLKNPFRRESKKSSKQKRLKRAKLILITGLIILLGAFSIWFFIFFKFWEIQKININGLSRVSKTEIQNMGYQFLEGKKMFFIPGNNIIFLSSSGLSQKIKGKYHFEEVEINKNFPDKLEINITENTCAYTLKEGNNYYKIDKNNYIIKKLRAEEAENPAGILIEDSVEGERCGEEKAELSPKYFEYIRNLSQELKKKKTDMEIKKFILDEECQADLDSSLVKMKINRGPVIYFNGQAEAEKQIERLFLVKDKLGPEFWSKQYITLEYGDRIFYQ